MGLDCKSDFQDEIKDENGDIDDDFYDAIWCSEVDEYGFFEKLILQSLLILPI